MICIGKEMVDVVKCRQLNFSLMVADSDGR